MTQRAVINKFNRGEVSPLALARDDVKQVVNSCELMENFLPMRLGPMHYRPGLEYIGDTEDPTTDQNRALIPHVRSIDDSVMYEFSGTTMRPLVDGLPIGYSSDTEVLTNDTFDSDITGWTGTGSWDTINQAAQIDYGENLYQTASSITVDTWHTYEVEILRGPVKLIVSQGSSTTAGDILDLILWPGTQLIQFQSPTTSFTVNFKSVNEEFGDGRPRSLVLGIDAKTSGNMEFTIPDLDWRTVSYDTSADVMYLAPGKDNHPRIIRRIGGGSGGECGYTFEKYWYQYGPYQSINAEQVDVDGDSRIGVAGISGLNDHLDTTDDQDRLLRVIHLDSTYSTSLSTVTADSTHFYVKGVGQEREILITVSESGVSGSWSVDLEMAEDLEGSTTWTTVRTYTAADTEIHTDRYDGETRRYRLNMTAAPSSGSIDITLQIVGLHMAGEGRLFYENSAWDGNLYSRLVWTDPTEYWQLGQWRTGSFPQGVTIYEGRVVWVSENKVDMTVTDDYYSFDKSIEGASAAISRTIGFGPVDDISWVESAGKLFIGLPTTEIAVRSNNFDEPLTSTNTNLKPGKGVGSKAVRAVPVDNEIYHVSREGKRIHQLSLDLNRDKQDSYDMMMLHPDVCADGVAAMDVSKHPEKRLWVLTETGELRVLLKEPTENVQAWCRATVDGVIEDICVIPKTGEDEVWMIVRRNNNSQIEKLSRFADIEPMDSFKRYTSPGTNTLTGLDHLNGETVGVWADEQDRGDATVSGGSVTVTGASGWTNIVVGLRYTAKYKSNKLGQYVVDSVIGERKRVAQTALVMRDYAPGRLTVGRDLNHLKALPDAVAGSLVTDYDEQAFSFGGTCNTDSRICLQATGPCTIMALAYNVNLKPAKPQDG